ncbi:glycoside hydrolase family 6 protein [Thermothielavioides terrestris NRRL 8126]|uniref:Glucanase n=1 Tax=Thermothielavioides terrestris (strain ATCC 38088 / NRRL 8126) TaxID=578455 RepID=G2QW39_THETT|nr:glycoside hydrolase family 6 protein [Thermothielavioides terrestris NRRL 8126]AEO62210.1 glycoside hydrolase family 6 protein [Thermothielavioides terrestris NRRL 8126]
MAQKLLLAAALAASALAAPVVEERQNCGSVWSQCGGIGWSGATCCASGNTCVELNPYYSQCLPNSQVTTSTSKTTSTTTRSSTTSHSSGPTSTSTTTTSSPVVTTPPSTSIPGGASSTASWSGNPFSGVQMWANDYYASEVSSLAIPSMTGAMATKAAEVAKVPSFQWLDRNVTIDTLFAHTLSQIRAANQKGANPPYAGIFVVYDLPDRDCAAAASNGEFSIANNGAANYKTYIDAIRSLVIQYSDIRIIFVIEPDSLANMVTNLNVAKCANAESTYKELTVYALQQLNLPNVAMYLDAGHAGWLGWPANIQPAANLFAEIYTSAGKPAAVRGLATNVANYNGWSLATPPSYTQGDPNYDESHYVQALAPLLTANGFPAHFITDTGRNGKQPTGQRQWGDWCNVIGTGFGVRPTTNTGLDIEDAFVWVKPGGECDGTSNTTSPRYDYHCGLSDALQPAPEAGTWFQAYFEQLLTNANPPF